MGRFLILIVALLYAGNCFGQNVGTSIYQANVPVVSTYTGPYYGVVSNVVSYSNGYVTYYQPVTVTYYQQVQHQGVILRPPVVHPLLQEV